MKLKLKITAIAPVLAWLWLLPASPAMAEDCVAGVAEDKSYFAVLDTLLRRPCYRQESRDTELGMRVSQILSASDAASAAEKAERALSEIAVYLTENYDRDDPLQTEATNRLTAALLKLRESVQTWTEEPPPDIKRNWQFSQLGRPPRSLRGIDFRQLLPEDRCKPFSERACETELAFAVQLVQAIHLANDALDTYTENYRRAVLADRKLRRTKWDSYYDDLTFQYPWELWTNSLLLEWTDDRRVEDGNRLGFRSLPGSKVVLLHPEVNLLYSQNAETEYDTAVSFELIGFENFDFDRRGKVDDAYGVSLMAAYVERPDGSDSGWTGGLMFKLNGYSLGVTDNHGETSLILNINLSQRLFDVKQDARRYYDEYEAKVDAFKQQLDN